MSTYVFEHPLECELKLKRFAGDRSTAKRFRLGNEVSLLLNYGEYKSGKMVKI